LGSAGGSSGVEVGLWEHATTADAVERMNKERSERVFIAVPDVSKCPTAAPSPVK
jgi:hypothetical protein